MQTSITHARYADPLFHETHGCLDQVVAMSATPVEAWVTRTFYAVAVNAAVYGLEALVPKKVDSINGFLVRRLRVVLGGTATRDSSDDIVFAA